jgi:hypothetical protein
MKLTLICALIGISAVSGAFLAPSAVAQSPYQSSTDFAKYASKLRESALTSLEPQVIVPTTSRPFGFGSGYPWKHGIVTTIFWVGEAASVNNPVHNRSSSWDLHWDSSFGGYDNPDPGARRNFIPASFVPRQNPFYVALPYNDVTHGATKPEARMVIPWFKKTFVREGQSVCHDRWVQIRNAQTGRTCYAQWSDCGPFRTDHWQYVFGNEMPKPNLNNGAGLDVSPAVRDYLGLGPISVTDWRFIEFRDVPKGPWAQYGDNNNFVQLGRQATERVASAAPPPTASHAAEGPRVLTK